MVASKWQEVQGRFVNLLNSCGAWQSRLEPKVRGVKLRGYPPSVAVMEREPQSLRELARWVKWNRAAEVALRMLQA